MRENLIVASYRISRIINLRRFCESFYKQLQNLQRDASIQELRQQQQNLYNQIRKKFNFIYRTEDQPIYDKYQHVKRNIDCLLKQKERVLKTQLQADYDAAASMQNMLAQITVNNVALFFVQSSSAPIKYVFEKRARIARVFFDLLLFAKHNKNLDRQITIIEDFVSLCNRQKRRSRKFRRT